MKIKNIGLVIILMAFNNAANAELVGHWNLNEGAGLNVNDTSLVPAAGVASNGLLENYADPALDWDQGLSGASDGVSMPHGLRLNGALNHATGNTVNLDSSSSNFSSLTQTTISAWFRRDIDANSTQGDGTIIGFGSTNSNHYFRLLIENGNEIMVNNEQNIMRFPFNNDGNWHHIAFTSDGSSSAVYYDGNLMVTGTIGVSEYGYSTLRLGNTHRNGLKLWYFDGTIGDVRIYDEVLDITMIDHISDSANYGDGLTSAQNLAPTANAGNDQTVHAGSIVGLNGSTSFDDNTAAETLTFEWDIASKPISSVASLVEANTSYPTFIVDVPGTYTLSLTVTDEMGLSSEPDFVIVSSTNLVPSSNIVTSSNIPVVNDTVYLDGSSSSDPDGDELQYKWRINSAPQGSSAYLTQRYSVSSSFSPDVEGSYLISLVASDQFGSGTGAEIEIIAISALDFVMNKISIASNLIANLPLNKVTTKGNKNAALQLLNNATQNLQRHDRLKALRLMRKVMKRTDGCIQNGEPTRKGNGRDWITDCDAQTEIYMELLSAEETLTAN